MTQYIDKSALVAEIEKRRKEAESNCGGYKSYDEHRCDNCTVGFYEEFLEILNTLEVKDDMDAIHPIEDVVSNDTLANSLEKRIIKKVLSPFVFCWFGACWCIMKLGRGIYWLGNKLSGDRIDPYNWTQEI